MKLPTKFCGEFEVMDDAFECIVDRFIYRESDVAFQFTCREMDYGKSMASGVAIKDSNGRYITTEFRLRYSSDNSDTPAQFTISKIQFSKDNNLLIISAIWKQAGESFSLEGELAKVES